MRHQTPRAGQPGSSLLLVFERGDEVMASLLEFARQSQITSASFSGIGAFRGAVIGFFDLEARDYARIDIDEQVEVLALNGNIALADGAPKVHAHVVLGKRDGTAYGGHLLSAVVRPTLELVLVPGDRSMQRTIDAATGLPLLSTR
jgi:predicted DNA-binding protein with PD1-like motif